MSLSLRLAEHVATMPYEALTPAAIEAAKRSLLDALAVSLGASGLEPACAPFVAQALAAQGAPHCTILGFDEKAPAPLAAFANGALAHALDYEDAYDGAPLHPNAALVPAALAIAEARGGVSGREFLAALATSCDLVCRLALCVRTPAEAGGWYPPPIYAAYGATAAAARLLGLDARALLDAFTLTLCQATCSGEIKNSPHAILRAVRDAFPAQTGVIAAQIAARGAPGFDAPFEGEFGFFRLFVAGDYDPDVLLRDLGQHFLGADVSFKPWPSCRGTHAFIEGALALRQAPDYAADAVERIDLRGGALQQMLVKPIETKRAPRTAIDAKFSLPYTVALALTHGRVALDDFTGEALADPAILALAHRVHHDVTEEFGRGNASSGVMSVHLRSGAVLARTVIEPRGAPANPMSWDDLVTKAIDCAARARRPWRETKTRRLAEIIAELERCDDVGAALAGALAPHS